MDPRVANVSPYFKRSVTFPVAFMFTNTRYTQISSYHKEKTWKTNNRNLNTSKHKTHINKRCQSESQGNLLKKSAPVFSRP